MTRRFHPAACLGFKSVSARKLVNRGTTDANSTTRLVHRIFLSWGRRIFAIISWTRMLGLIRCLAILNRGFIEKRVQDTHFRLKTGLVSGDISLAGAKWWGYITTAFWIQIRYVIRLKENMSLPNYYQISRWCCFMVNMVAPYFVETISDSLTTIFALHNSQQNKHDCVERGGSMVT